jgi:hypothetical protein
MVLKWKASSARIQSDQGRQHTAMLVNSPIDPIEKPLIELSLPPGKVGF